MEKKERKAARDEILADFQFWMEGSPEEHFAGMTINISPLGFCFCTETAVKKGQTITITRHLRKGAMPDFTGKKAKVIWTKKGHRYYEAGAKVIEAASADSHDLCD